MTHVFSGSKETGDSTYAVELTREYQLSKSEWRGGRLKNREAAAHERLNKGHSATTSKASEYISSKYDPEGLYGPEPFPFQTPGAEKCHRMLNTWVHKCEAVN